MIPATVRSDESVRDCLDGRLGVVRGSPEQATANQRRMSHGPRPRDAINYIPMYPVVLDPWISENEKFRILRIEPAGSAKPAEDYRLSVGLASTGGDVERERRALASLVSRRLPEDFEGRDHLERSPRAGSSDRGADASRRARS